MVAKVISPNGNIFFVPQGREIHQEIAYDSLPLEDKKYLAFHLIIGTDEGYIVKSDGRDPVIVSENCLPLILPAGTRIEAFPQKPSLIEK